MSNPILPQIFSFPPKKHNRKHGPMGYINYESYKPWLRDEFQFRCVYCLRREMWEQDPDGNFSIEHIVPQSIDPNLICHYDNLVFACMRCNRSRQNRSGVLDPCQYAFGNHVRLLPSGEFDSLTKLGSRHIEILKLNDREVVELRKNWMETLEYLSLHGDAVAQEKLRFYLSYPNVLPNLKALRPPGGNSRRAGLATSYHALRLQGLLPDTY